MVQADARPARSARARPPAEVASRPLSSSEASGLLLAIEADPDRYRFWYGPFEEVLCPRGEGETRYLSTEVAGGFTGVFLAMVASGNGAPRARPADFDGFEHSPSEEPAPPRPS